MRIFGRDLSRAQAAAIMIAALAAILMITDLLISGSVDYEYTFSVNAPGDKVWQYIEIAMTDSSQTYWPNDLETMQSDSIKKGSTIIVEYNTGLWKKSYTYLITEVEKGRRITFAPDRHPMKGKNSIEIRKFPDRTDITFRWNMTYRGASTALIYFRTAFPKHFRTELRGSLARFERSI